MPPMRYCPSCLNEYVDDTERCTDCGTELVGQEAYERVAAQREAALTEPYAEVCILEGRFEAPVLEGALEAQGIRVLIRPYQDSAYDGLFIPQQGWGSLSVPTRQLEQAREIVQATRDDVRARAQREPSSDEG